MTETTREVLLFGLSLAVPLGLFGLRQALSRFGRGDSRPSVPWADAVLSAGNAAILCGVAIGLTALPAIDGIFDEAASTLVVFASAWCGFTIGCGIDLRVLRKTSSILLASQLGQCIVALAAIPLLTWAMTHLPWTGMQSVLLSPIALLIVVGVCLSEGVVVAHDRDHRHRAGGGIHKGFTKTSNAAFAAILLASLGAGLDPLAWTHLTIASHLPLPTLTLSMSGLGERMLWGVIMGCSAGLLCDLVAKDHSSTGVTFAVLAAVLLLFGGIATAFGVQPLLIGVIAGAWVINATLRRLDVHHVIEKSTMVGSIGIPFLVGWTIGHGVTVNGISGQGFLIGLCLLVAMRPIVRTFGWRLGERMIKAKNPTAVSREGESLLFDQGGFAFLLSLVLAMTISGPMGVGFLTAVVVSQVVFALISVWWPPPVAEPRKVT